VIGVGVGCACSWGCGAATCGAAFFEARVAALTRPRIGARIVAVAVASVGGGTVPRVLVACVSCFANPPVDVRGRAGGVVAVDGFVALVSAMGFTGASQT
jgi:hypothetical protein